MQNVWIRRILVKILIKNQNSFFAHSKLWIHEPNLIHWRPPGNDHDQAFCPVEWTILTSFHRTTHWSDSSTGRLQVAQKQLTQVHGYDIFGCWDFEEMHFPAKNSQKYGFLVKFNFWEFIFCEKRTWRLNESTVEFAESIKFIVISSEGNREELQSDVFYEGPVPVAVPYQWNLQVFPWTELVQR